MWSADYPFAPTEEEYLREFEFIRSDWGGTRQVEAFVRDAAPLAAGDAGTAAWMTRMFRQGASPGAARATP